MDAQPGPTPEQEGARAHHETHETQDMQVRRSPRYGVFMGLGALLGMLVAWAISAAMPPAVNEAGQQVDTSPVIGLMLVVGFVVGGALGAVVALLIDRALAKRLHPVTAERVGVAVDEPEREPEADGALSADAGDARFEHLEHDGDRGAALPPQAPGELPRDDRDDRPREG